MEQYSLDGHRKYYVFFHRMEKVYMAGNNKETALTGITETQ